MNRINFSLSCVEHEKVSKTRNQNLPVTVLMPTLPQYIPGSQGVHSVSLSSCRLAPYVPAGQPCWVSYSVPLVQ